jgi:hypothetical protein
LFLRGEVFKPLFYFKYRFEGGRKMKVKIVCILVMTLLIASALPAVGIMNIGNTTKTEPNDPQPAATKTDYLSVPAAAFIPSDDSTTYHNFGTWLAGEWGAFCAPVYLPNGATVNKVTFYWHDSSVAGDAWLTLIRYPFSGYDEFMAEVYSSGNAGSGFSEDNTIDYAVIDNIGYSYFLWVEIPDLLYTIYYNNVLIEYTYETGGSSGEDIVENEQTQVSQDPIVSLRQR